MSIPSRYIRSIRDIRTLEGWGDLTEQPYRAHMKISCLEMEKARREKERESALNRIRSIDDRLREIEVEKANLLKKLGISHDDTAVLPSGAVPPKSREGGFRVRY